MKHKTNNIFLYIAITLLSISSALAQENCTNGVDDDGDGFIDCYDGDCAGGPSCADFFYGNPIVCKDEPTENPTFTMKLQWGSEDRSADSHATPAVGDLDNDGLPEVVVINRLDERLFILNGEDGTTAFTYDLGYQPENGIVLANLDGGDCANIYISRDNSSTITALDCEANFLWQTNASDRVGIMGIADFNGDGNPELYYKTEIMDAATGNIIVAGTADNWVQKYAHSAIAVDILDDSFCADCSGLELITGNQIWAINIAAGTRTLAKDLNNLFAAEVPVNNKRYYTKYFNTNQNRTAISVADYNLDGHVDVLMPGAYGSSNSSQTTIFFWDVFNDSYLVYDGGVNHSKGTGRLNVADIDGDGQMNTTYVSDQILYALDENLNVLWTKGIDEGSSGFTGTTVFDFDGDGAAETIYRSESYLYIIDGTDGSTRTTVACKSRTQEEYPLVADVDNDGSSELCVPCYTSNNTPFSPYNNTRFSQIRIYEADGGEIWQPSRRVWNQHGYYNVNVNDDLTIPAQQQDHTAIFGTVNCDTGLPEDNRALNGFLNQSTFLEADGCPSYVSPDINMAGNIVANPSLCPLTTFDISFDIENTGDTDIFGTLPVTFYNGDPETPGAIKLNTETVLINNFLQGETRTINMTVEGSGGDFDLYISINNNGQDPPITPGSGGFPECDFSNNIANVPVTYTPFTLTVNKLEENRRCDPSKPNNGEAEAYFEGTLGGGYETFWVEDFTGLPNGDRSDAGSTAWTSTKGSFNPIYWGVNTKSGNKVYRTRKTGQNNEVSEVTWLSEVIDISNHIDVDISLDMLTNNTLEASGGGRDYMRAFYIVDGGAETEFDVNGELYGSFLYAVAEQEDLNGSTLQIKVTFHTTGNGEYQFLDNVQVSGTTAPVVQQFTDADGFEFDWYNAGDFSAPVANGSLYTGMPTGSYDVVGYYPGGNCYSDTVNIVINDSIPTFNVHVYEAAPYTDCADPDGALSSFVYTQTDGSGNPLDTLTLGYTFSWVLSTEGITPVGTGPNLTNIGSDDYTVRVEQVITGCSSSASGAPSSGLTFPADPTVSKTDIIACTGPGTTGAASASVGGITAGYNFEWFYESIDATPDYTGSSVTGLLAGTYYVRAVDNGSSCPSSFVTFDIIDTSPNPNPSAVEFQADTECGGNNGIAVADGDGAGTVAGYTFEWFVGNNTLPGNLLPAALPGSSITPDGATASGLASGTYTVRATRAGCQSTTTVEITDAEIVPAYNIVTQVPAGNALQVTDKAYVRMPQLLSGTSSFTLSYWVEISTQNYLDDHRIFSSGGKNESQVMLWTSDVFGISFVVKAESAGTVGKINTLYKPTGWVQLTGTWDEATGEMKLYANGVKVGETTYFGDNPAILEGVIDNGPDMYLARDGNLGANKFEGRIDEVKIYNRVLDESEILTVLCDPAGGSTTGLQAHYDFNGVLSTANGATVPDVSGNGNNGTLDKPGAAPGSVQYVTSGIQCPLAGMVNNTSCDPANPNGEINLVGAVDPQPANYEYTLYEGTEVDPTELLATNTTGIFSSLPDGFYTVVTRDQDTNCETDPLTLSIATLPEEPSIITSITDNTGCSIGNGEILVTSSSISAEPSSYTYELYDGYTYTTLLQTETVANGSTGFNFTGLTTGEYRIHVTNDDILCEGYVDVYVDDASVNPTWNHPSTIENPNSVCVGTPNGFASVAPVGTLSNFTFEWYTGELVDPGQLIAGENQEFIDELANGKYTVVATSTITGCETPPKTVTINLQPVNPNIVTVEVQPQHSCDVGDGILRAYVDEPDPSDCVECDEADDYSFQWFLGNDTSTPLIENTDPGNNSNPTNVDSSRVEGLTGGYDYTVQVTNNITGCTNEATISLTYDPQSPTIDAGNTQITANTLCGTMGNGSIIAAVDFVGETINGALNDQPWQVITDCNTETDLDSNILPDGSIQLTPDAGNRAGKAYLGDSVDFSTPTRIDFWMYLGDKDVGGADGITFIFHQDADGKNALGRYGCNLGIGDEACFAGAETAIQPSIAVEFDTYQNPQGYMKEPAYDHTNFVINGDMSDPQGDVGVFYNVNQPRIVNGQDDVEAADQELRVTITILPNFDGTQTFSVYVEDELRLQRTQDFINDLFGGNPKTIGGFTASTGGSKNQQYVRLDPYFGEYDFDWYEGPTADPSKLIPGADKPYLCDLLGGEYTMVVTYNRTGCTSSPPETFVVPNNTDTASVSFSGVSNTVCDTTLAIGGNFTGSLTANIAQNPADYTFAWFEGSAPTADTLATTQSITNIPGGDYTVVVESLAGGCISIRDTTLVDVTVDPAIIDVNADVTINNVTSCEGSATYPNGSIDIISVNGSGGPYGYLYWFGSDTTSGTLLNDASDIFAQTGTPGTASVNVSGNGTATLTGLSAGDYTIIVIDSLNGCTSIEANVQLIDDPTIPDLGRNITANSICDPALAASGAYDGEIEITTNDGSDPVTDYAYDWYEGTGTTTPVTLWTINDNILSEAPDGNYTVVATSNVTGCDTTIYATIGDISSIPTIDNVTTQNVTACEGGPAYPNGSITVAGVTGAGPFGYMYWYGADTTTGTFLDDNDDIFDQTGQPGSSSINVSGNGTTTLSNLSAGDYTIIVIDSASGCTSIEANVQIINVPTIPDLSRTIVDNTVCDNTINNSLAFDGSITITTNDGSDPILDYTYAWYDGTGVGPVTAYTVNDNVLSEAPDGNYTVVATSQITGCDTTIFATIGDATVDPVLGTINVTDMSVCDGAAVYPNGVIEVDESTVTNGNIADDYSYEFYWGASVDVTKLISDGDDIVNIKSGGTGVPVSITNNIISNLDTGFYTIVLIDNESGCPANEVTIQIDVAIDPMAIPGSVTHLTNCSAPNGEIAVTPTMAPATEPLGGYSYQWYFGSGTGNILDGTSDLTDPSALAGTTSATVIGLEAGTYTVLVTNNDTECTETAEFDIEDNIVFPTFVGAINVTDNTNCSGAPNGIIDPDDADFSPAGTYTFELFNAANVSQGTSTTDFQGLAAGNYRVAATNNTTGCTIISTVPVTITDDLTSPALATSIVSNETNCSSPNGQISISTIDPTPVGNWDVNVFRGTGIGGQNVFSALGSGLSNWTTQDTLSSGTYTIQLINNETGCDSLRQSSIIPDFLVPAISNVVKVNNSVCDPAIATLGDYNGSITINTITDGGSSPVYSIYTGSSATGIPDSTSSDNVFENLPTGTFTVTATNTDSDSQCESNAVTRTISNSYPTLTPSLTVDSDQTSCDLTDPNGQITVDMTSPTVDPNDYIFQWFKGFNTNPANEINTSAVTSATFSGVNNQTVIGLPAGNYRVKITHRETGCTTTADETIILSTTTPAVDGVPTFMDNTSCTSPDGQIGITINNGGSLAINDGAAGYLFELFVGTSIGVGQQPIDKDSVITAAPTSTTFTGLLEGDYVIRATDNNTSCKVVSSVVTVGYGGMEVVFDEPNFDLGVISDCFTDDGYIDVTSTGGVTSINGNASIAWYIGTDTSNIANLVSTQVPGAIFTPDLNVNGTGFALQNARVDNLPAVVYSGVVTYDNGCKRLIQTDLTQLGSPNLTLTPTDPTFCSPPNGSIDIVLEAISGNSPDQYNYYVFEGSRSILNDADGMSPYSPTLGGGTYNPILASGSFASGVPDDTEIITINNLDSGLYTIAIEVAADFCITGVQTVTLNPPAQPNIVLDAISTFNNTVCDPIVNPFRYNGQITIDVTPADTYNFDWYYDGNGNGNFSEPGALGQLAIAYVDGGAGAGSNPGVTNAADNSEITGLGDGWYRVIAVSTTTGCEDTLDIQLFNDPLPLTFDPGVVTSSNVLDCDGTPDNDNEFGVFQFPTIEEDGVPLAADFASGNFVIDWDYDADQDGTFEVSPFGFDNDQNDATNLTAGDYRLTITSQVSGCIETFEFTVDDLKENPIIDLVSDTDNTICDGNVASLNLAPNGEIIIQLVDDTNTPIPTAGNYDIFWFEDAGHTDPVGTTVGQIDAGMNNERIFDLPGGTYYVEVIDNSGDNEDCVASTSFTIIDDPEEVELKTTLGVDIDKEHQQNCDPVFYDGRIEILQVYQDGVAIDINVVPNIGVYAIEWFESDQTTALGVTTATATTSGADNQIADQLPAGTYYVQATNTTTDCKSTKVAVTILDQTVNPNIQIIQNSVDTSCDPDIAPNSKSGTGSITASVSGGSGTYTYTWYEGDGTVATVAEALSPQGANVVATGYSIVGGSGQTVNNLPDGTYYIEVTDDADPGRGCVGSETITIQQFTPVISIGAKNVDYITTNDVNCTSDNGSITIIAVNETQPGGGSIRNTTVANYTFSWYDAPSGGNFLGNGFFFDDGGAGLSPITYYVEVQRNSSECVSGNRKAITVQEVTSNPLVQLVSKTPDDYCVGAPANQGSGSLTARINHEGNPSAPLANYNITWYRGSTATPGNELFVVANQGSADNNSSPTQMILDSLSTGTYTVSVSKNGTPNDGCATTSTFTINRDAPTYSLPLSAMTISNNFNCTNPPNGAIRINGVVIDGAFQAFSNPTSDNYSISWSAGTPHTVTFADDSVSNLASGTYVATVTNNRTNCSVSASITIKDITSNPLIQLAAKSSDEYCVGATANEGSGSLTVNINHEGNPTASLANYNITWYRGSSATPGNELFTVANQGSAIDNSSATQMILDSLSTGKYTVVVSKNGSPNSGCQATNTFTINRDEPTYSLPLSAMTITNNFNCDNPNGSIRIDGVVIDGVFQSFSSPGSDSYTINWTAPPVAPQMVVFPNDSLGGISAGTYTVDVTNNRTNCMVSASVIINDITTNPLVQLVIKQPDEYCDNTGFQGNGSLQMRIVHEGNNPANAADYDITWYRGSTATLGNELFIPANQGSALSAGAGTQLSGLSTGTYTVTAMKNSSPNDQCLTTTTFSIIRDEPQFSIQTSSVVVAHNTNCTTPNGSIQVTHVLVDGVAQDLTAVGADYAFTWPDGTPAGTINSLNDNATGLAAGTYKIIGENVVTGCSTDTINVIILDDPTEPDLSFTVDAINTNCGPTKNGQLTVTASTADGNPFTNVGRYTFTWYDGQGTATATSYAQSNGAGVNDNQSTLLALDSGYYTVEVFDNLNECTTIGTYAVSETLDVPKVLLSKIVVRADSTCDIGSSGTIIVADTSFATGVLDDFDVEIRSGTSTGPILAQSTAGSGNTDLTISSLDPGTFYVTATRAASQCPAAPVKVIILDERFPPTIQLDTMIANPNCGGTIAMGSIAVTADGFDETNPDYIFQWYVGTIGGGVIVPGASGGNTATMINVAEGQYELSVTNVNTGCVGTQLFNLPAVPVNPRISSYEVSNNLICNMPGDGSFEVNQIRWNGNFYEVGITADSLNIVTNYTFEYYSDAALTTAVADLDPSTPLQLDGLSAGTYYARVRRNDSQCASGPIEFTIQDIPQYPVIQLTQLVADSTCNGMNPNGTISALVDGVANDTLYTYDWFEIDPVSGARISGSLSNNDTISGLAAGRYEVEVTGVSTGCVSTARRTVINAPIEVRILSMSGIDPTSCDPPNGVIEVTGITPGVLNDYTFTFYLGDPGSGGVQVQTALGTAYASAEAGTYYVEATHNIYGCTNNLYEIVLEDNLTYPDIDLVSFANQTNCDPGVPNGELSATADGSTDDTAYTFEWRDASNNIVEPNNATLSDIPAGAYTLYATDNSTGCMSSATFDIIDDYPDPIRLVISTSPNTNCTNPNGEVSATIRNLQALGKPITDYQFYWFNGDQTAGVPDIANPDYFGTLITDLPDGDYTVYVVDATDGFCTSDPTLVTIQDRTLPPPFQVEIQNHVTICYDSLPNGRARINPASLEASRELFEFRYEWYVGTAADTAGQAPFVTGIRADSLDIGTYSVLSTDLRTGCESLVTLDIIDDTDAVPAPDVNVVSDRDNCIFANGHAVASISGSITGYRFEWFLATGDTTTVQFTGHEIFTLDSVDYKVRATRLSTGCISPRTPVEIINAIEDPVFEIATTTSLCLRTEDGAFNQFTGTAEVIFSQFGVIKQIDWIAPDGTVFSNDIKLVNAQPGRWTVRFVLDNDCEYFGTFGIETALKIYNGVSANADGLNDYFFIDCIDYFPNNNVQIFNRDGTKVWESDAYNNNDIRFDGFSNVGRGGLQLPAGTYFYIIEKGPQEWGTDEELTDNTIRPRIQGYLELVR